ncbi:hypothetical protein E1A91_A03G087400v1, partial [Gossypium mustelinum]
QLDLQCVVFSCPLQHCDGSSFQGQQLIFPSTSSKRSFISIFFQSDSLGLHSSDAWRANFGSPPTSISIRLNNKSLLFDPVQLINITTSQSPQQK